MNSKKLRIAFIHPDLGIGGAERLIVDSAVGLQDIGHDITIYTSHCDKQHAFKEVQDDVVKVKVKGDIPQLAYGFYILVAIMRQLYLVSTLLIEIHVTKREKPYDIYFVDQLSTCIPILKLFTSSKICFYGHFPDKLLSTSRSSVLKRVYRYPFDKLEQFSTNCADIMLVNSKFTLSVFKQTFPNLSLPIQVLYPGITTFESKTSYINNDSDYSADYQYLEDFKTKDGQFLLSINRFEGKKMLSLAIETLHELIIANTTPRKVKLIVAGGYDPRIADNVRTLQSLQDLCSSLNIKHTIRHRNDNDVTKSLDMNADVLFITGFNEVEKQWLLSNATILLYTPAKEHFGIVPVESMYNQCPVCAVASGGPLETIEEGKTGFLREQSAKEFSDCALRLLKDMKLKAKMGKAGRQHVLDNFAASTYISKLNKLLLQL